MNAFVKDRQSVIARVAAAVSCVAVLFAACDVHSISGPGSLASIVVTPNVTLAINASQQFVAVGKDADGAVVAILPEWSIESGGGAISTTGKFVAGTVPGTYTSTVKATSGGIFGTATVTVTIGPLATITVSPTPDTLAITTVRQYSAVGKDAGGNIVTIAPTWSVVAGGGAIDAAALFTAGTVPGTFANTVQAASGSILANATVVVTVGPLATITVTPNPDTIPSNATQQYAAVGKDAGGNVVALAPVWSVVALGGAINPAGLFTAGGVAGTFLNTVQASSGVVMGHATVVVTAIIPPPPVLTSITVTPNPMSLAINGTQQYTAVGKDAGGNVMAIVPSWSVVAGGGAINGTGLFTAGIVAGTFINTIQATSGAISGTATVTVIAGPLATITVTPNPVTLALSGTQQYTAVGKDASGNVVALVPAWSVVAGGGAINGTGLFTAGVVSGTFTNTVQATSGAISGNATVTVTTGALATITVTPNPVTLAINGTQQYVATGRDGGGNVVAITPAWTVVAGGGAINGTGMFTAGIVPGTFTNTVQATSGAITGNATVTVVAGPLATIDVTPNPVTLPIDGTQQYTAVGKDAGGNVVAIAPSWSVVAGGGAINGTGLFTAGIIPGTFTNTVQATSGVIVGNATVTVTTGPLATIDVTPNPVTLSINGTQQYTAVGKDAGGNVLVIAPSWTVVAGGGAINGTGLFTAGIVPGTFTNTVQATSGAIVGNATVTVTTGPLATIDVTPNPVTLSINGTQQFTAVGKDAGGNVVVIAPSWTVVAGGGAINGTGLFTAGTIPGTFTNTVRATSGAIVGNATVTVVVGPVATIDVTPNPATMAISATQQFTAVGKDAGGNVVAITPTWSVVNGGGTINGTGLFTAGLVDSTYVNTVQATSGAISGNATIIISPPSPLIPLGVAGTYGILASTAVSCVGPAGSVGGDIGVSPAGAITGFVANCTFSGTQHVNDAPAAAAQSALTIAYDSLFNLPCGNAIVADLGATTLPTGVYCTASAIGVTGVLTLDGGGDKNATFVFRGSAMTTAGDVVFINKAQAKNVYFAVSTSATLGTASQWQGNVIALTSITLVDNATLNGRALARNGAITLGTGNVITLP